MGASTFFPFVVAIRPVLCQIRLVCEAIRTNRSSAGTRGGAAGGAEGAAGTGPGFTGEERIAQAYSVLEAEPRMSDEQIVKAYRRQMSRHHPDKLKANGLPDSMLERAKERTQQIQAAYEAIRARRGMR